MIKRAIHRAAIGFPLGVFISYTTAILIALVSTDTDFIPAVPAFITRTGNEVNAVVLQYLLAGILGAGVAGSTVVWENEQWSLMKRTIVHLLSISLVLFPTAYLTYWMEHTLLGIVIYFLVFTGIYVIIWAIQYMMWMRKVNDINRRLQRK